MLEERGTHLEILGLHRAVSQTPIPVMNFHTSHNNKSGKKGQ